jgi:hypothetical protein
VLPEGIISIVDHATGRKAAPAPLDSVIRTPQGWSTLSSAETMAAGAQLATLAPFAPSGLSFALARLNWPHSRNGLTLTCKAIFITRFLSVDALFGNDTSTHV